MSGLFDDLDTEPTAQPESDTTDSTTTTSNDESDTVTSPVATEDKVEPSEPRKTLQVEAIDKLPTGFVDVRAFAWELTKRNLETATKEGRTPGPDDMVDTQAVYAATRGKRWSLPALEATDAAGTKLGLVIPLAEGLQAWEQRPERGVGGGASMTPQRRETRILRAGKFKAQLTKMQKRESRITELLNEVGATWADADEAYNAWLETEDGKKEIADSNTNGDNGDE